MTSVKTKTITEESTEPQEWWTIIQVASFLGLKYQEARNNMLCGDYGPSAYEPKARKLTVRADRVQKAKGKKVVKSRKRRRARTA